MTSQKQIAISSKFAVALEEVILTNYNEKVSVVVDDWDDYGGFQAFIQFIHIQPYPKGVYFGKVNLNSLGFTIKRVAKENGVYIRSIEMPKRLYWNDHGCKVFDGYDSADIKIHYNSP